MFLRKLRDGFVGRLLGGAKGPGEAKTPIHSENYLFKSPVRDVLDPDKANSPSSYESTKMWRTRDSLFWGWRRMSEYFRDLVREDPKMQVRDLVTS